MLVRRVPREVARARLGHDAGAGAGAGTKTADATGAVESHLTLQHLPALLHPGTRMGDRTMTRPGPGRLITNSSGDSDRTSMTSPAAGFSKRTTRVSAGSRWSKRALRRGSDPAQLAQRPGAKAVWADSPASCRARNGWVDATKGRCRPAPGQAAAAQFAWQEALFASLTPTWRPGGAEVSRVRSDTC